MAGLFVDTWGWVALLDRKDEHHAATDRLSRDTMATSTPLFTSWAVVAELFTFACSKRGLHAWGPERGGRIIAPLREWLESRELVREVLDVSPADWRKALDLRESHRSVGDLSLVDCSIPVVCEPRGITDVVSGDAHLRLVFRGVRLLPQDGA